MKEELMKNRHCSTCGRVYNKGTSKKPILVCENGKAVDKRGICDRWIHEITVDEFFKRCNESIRRMESYQEGTYEITDRPPLGTNYRIDDE